MIIIFNAEQRKTSNIPEHIWWPTTTVTINSTKNYRFFEWEWWYVILHLCNVQCTLHFFFLFQCYLFEQFDAINVCIVLYRLIFIGMHHHPVQCNHDRPLLFSVWNVHKYVSQKVHKLRWLRYALGSHIKSRCINFWIYRIRIEQLVRIFRNKKR